MKAHQRGKASTLALFGLTALLAWGALGLPRAQARRGSSTEQANKAVVRRFFEEIFNQGNLAAVDELVAPDLVVHGPRFAAPAAGTGPLDRVRQVVSLTRAIWPDLHLTIEDQIAEGDRVVSRWTRRGTQKGEMRNTPLGTIPPTGKEVTIAGVTLFRIENGKIAEIWLSPDNLGTFQQLGVIPPAPPAAARP